MKKTPVIHQTDLFHPHNDPDDHWDLACQYALAHLGNIDLRGVLLDYSPAEFSYGDPSIQSVNQLNYLTNLAVPCGVGLPKKVDSDATIDKLLADGRGLSGVQMVLDILARSEEKVAIHIVGSSRDIAVAMRKSPELFREKCKALYLNAGASNPESGLEYNVVLDPFTYSLMFQLPCPVYWMPCFDMIKEPLETGEFGTFYRFDQKDILPSLSPSMQNFFLYALTRAEDHAWLAALEAPVDGEALARFGQDRRQMWCTGGFFHAAGLTVLHDGRVAPLGESPDKEVFRFEPVAVSCNSEGYTDWRLSDQSAADCYIFRILDLERYESAMTTAMRELIAKLP